MFAVPICCSKNNWHSSIWGRWNPIERTSWALSPIFSFFQIDNNLSTTKLLGHSHLQWIRGREKNIYVALLSASQQPLSCVISSTVSCKNTTRNVGSICSGCHDISRLAKMLLGERASTWKLAIIVLVEKYTQFILNVYRTRLSPPTFFLLNFSPTLTRLSHYKST